MFDSIRRGRFAAVIVTLMYAFCSDQALAVPVLLSGIRDLSQHDDSSFVNYCGPTAAANVVQYFRTLHGNNLLGVTPNDDAAANGLIGAPVGLSPPHGTPAAGSLAARMSTSLRDGTTPNNLRDGLDSYLEDTHDGVVGGSDWDTQLLLTQSAGGSLSGADFWSELQAAGNAGKGIILLIDWLPNPMSPPSTLPPESNDDQEYDPPESPGQGATVSIGHTVTMTGYELLGGSGLDTLYLNDSGNNKSDKSCCTKGRTRGERLACGVGG